ncbi:MAG: HEPN domain-containing protein [Burkholderiales bacterium]|nr:HEPN domain-containing protein [Burkholderiales bacterium]
MDGIARARVALKLEQLEAKLKSFLANLRARNPRECVSAMYFAVFHAAEALLCAKGIEASSHKAVASLLALHFVRPGALPRETSAQFSALMAGRHDADYNEAIPFGQEDARAAAASGLPLLAHLLGALEAIEDAPPAQRVRRLMARIAKAVPRGRNRGRAATPKPG